MTEREAQGQQALGLTPQMVHDEIPELVRRIRENARRVQEQIDGLRSTPEYADAAYLGPAWGDLHRRDRDAILQPPKPEIIPASTILERIRERQAAREPEHS